MLLGQGSYVLAAAFSQVALHPIGLVNGFSGTYQHIFLRSFLEKYFGVIVQKFQRKEYKGAGDFLARDGISEFSRKNELDMLNSIYKTFFRMIIEDRESILKQKSTEALEKLVPEILFTGPYVAEHALELGLIDSQQYQFDVVDKIKTNYRESNNVELTIMNLPQYVKIYKRQQKLLFQNHKKEQAKYRVKTHDVECISLLHIGGPITSVTTDTFVNRLDRINKDNNITSVILRIDCPGGGIVESSTVYAYIDKLKNEGKKKVIVSMTNVAASGGYYISMPADKVFAHRSTITGSIGVVSIQPRLQKSFLSAYGINVETLNVDHAPERDPLFGPIHPLDRQRIDQYLDHCYKDFVQRAATSRGVTFEQMEPLSRGKVYTGEQAHAIGLVDDLGGIIEAIDYARTDHKTGLKKPYVLTTLELPFKEAVKDFIQDKINPFKMTLGIDVEKFKNLRQLIDSQYLYLYVPDNITEDHSWVKKLFADDEN